MYLLDTNVVSELRRPRPDGAVLAWVETIPDEHLHLSAVTLGELQAGVEIARERDPAKAAEIEPGSAASAVSITYYLWTGRASEPGLG